MRTGFTIDGPKIQGFPPRHWNHCITTYTFDNLIAVSKSYIESLRLLLEKKFFLLVPLGFKWLETVLDLSLAHPLVY